MNIFEFDLDNVLPEVFDNVKEDTKDFNSIINLNANLNREVYLYDIEEGTGASIDAYIRFWNEQDKKNNIPKEEREPIKLIIDSGGGLLSDTFTIIDSIKASETPVIGICIGIAYSGGFFSFIACHKRYAYPHASFLFHEGSTSSGGTSTQFANFASFYKKQLEQIKDIVIENTNISEKEYAEIKKDDVWYNVKDGIEKGFIDEVISNIGEI